MAVVLGWIVVVLMVVFTLGGSCMAYPQYNLYSQRLSGEAELARAESNRRILVEQAQAERDAAKMRAEAIAIVGKAAKDFPEYRTQEFIGAFAEALQRGTISQIIYVPTEGNIPVLEAGKR